MNMPVSGENIPFPSSGRLLGVDYGTKRVGLAISNFEQSIASPLETLHRRDEFQDGRRLTQIVREFAVVGLVVGLPVHMSGDEGEKAREARAFGGWISRTTGRPVVFADERYSSAQANEYLAAAQFSPKKRKEIRDMLAAQIVLQTFLDSSDRAKKPGSLI
jgi:putative holliday junction resolvase